MNKASFNEPEAVVPLEASHSLLVVSRYECGAPPVLGAMRNSALAKEDRLAAPIPTRHPAILAQVLKTQADFFATTSADAWIRYTFVFRDHV